MSDAAIKKQLNKSKNNGAENIKDPSSQVIEGNWGKEKKSFLRYDWPLFTALILILFYGLIVLYSVSSYSSLLTFGYSYYYVRKQVFATLFGLVVMIAVSFIPMGFWKKMSIPIFCIGLVLIFLVKTSLGVESNGAVRWLRIGGLSIQPSEVLKFAAIIMLAYAISKFEKWIDNWRIFFPIFIMGLVPAGLVAVITDDLGTAIIFFAILFVMLFIGCKDFKYLAVSAVILVAAAVYFIASEPYRLNRIKAWVNIEAYADSTGYQIIQGLYAIGSGGIFGKGLGKSTQKLTFVPEAENDMIFSILCEELGIFGVLILCILYGFIIWRMFKIFQKNTDLYSRLVVSGVAAHIGLQAVVNMFVVTNLFPNTGVPLPFISYGGTSTLILLAEMGLVMAAARGSGGRKRKKAAK